MPLASLARVLAEAEKGSYAVGAFNVVGEDTFYGVLQAALAENLPVIINIAEAHLSSMHWEPLLAMIRREVEQVPIPVVIHLDHGRSLPVITKALALGFTSVMFDGSYLPLRQNIEVTREIARLAHGIGVSVEGELGSIGGAGGEFAREVPADIIGYTDPAHVPAYLEQTGVDALAVSIGTVHGLCKNRPLLDLALLERIHRVAKVPLVLHGGSGLSDEDFNSAIARGIRKINYYTEISQAAIQSVRNALQGQPDLLHYPVLSQAAQKGVRELACRRIRAWHGSVA